MRQFNSLTTWLFLTGHTLKTAATALGITEQQVIEYQNGPTPLHIELACAALYHRIDPWGKTRAGKNGNRALNQLHRAKIAKLAAQTFKPEG
ncbi:MULTISPECIES: hypothetical protein [unclassified Rhizobium]|uniref:hypothetical protein n=1 Tax=unclassified Rhizobium TaxID=2613769 RepID=UPI000AF01F2B|nr:MULTISPECIES: hypothetical protein [unclassified Rhizobium]